MKHDIELKRHSLEHVMVLAVRRLIDKDIKLGVGPVIENGFYQDFDYAISSDDFEKIEEEMKSIMKEDLTFEREEIEIDAAIKYFQEQKQDYKVELLKDIKAKGTTKVNNVAEEEAVANLTEGGKVSFYTVGIHKDLCRGPHVESTGQLKGMAFKLDRIAGAYWRGDEKNKMLNRIYAVAFESQKELDDYYFKIEEAKKRDHRIIGKDLKIFMFSDLVGPGLPLYLPNGGVMVSEIEGLLRSIQSRMGYDHVYSCHIAKEEMYTTSGHLQWYKDSMFPPMEMEGDDYYLKPMSCPHHIQMYANEIRSYRDLPVKMAEFGDVYRYEQSGELGGLLRTRGFTQDDAHIFCRPDQVVEIFSEVVELLTELLDGLGLYERKYRLSLKDDTKDKYAGNEEDWEKATDYIREALKKYDIEYYEAPGEAAFYGPKLDVIFMDALGREWQISTVQVDFLQPERFGLEYVGEDGKNHRPFMIHRAPLGSRGRIIAVLLEHYAGAMPTWLSPLQVKVLPINDDAAGYAKKVVQELKNAGVADRLNIRVEADYRDERLQKKIKDASDMKTPYILVCGKREEEAGQVAVRVRGKGDIGTMPLGKFVEELMSEVKERKIELSIG